MFVRKLNSDVRIGSIHLVLSVALCDAWATADFSRFFNVKRASLMRVARIRSIATYHKAIKDLQTFGYIKYYPSYNPAKPSQVEVLTCEPTNRTNASTG